MARLLRISSWSPTWESVYFRVSRVPARPSIPVPLFSPRIIMQSTILLWKAVAFAMDMLTTVNQPGPTFPAHRRSATWWAAVSWFLWNGLQVRDSSPIKMPSCANVLRCCATLKSADAFSLSQALWCCLGTGFCSHHSLVTQLCAGMCYWSGGLQWRLNIKPQLYLPLQGFEDAETLIMVFGLIL